MKRLLLFLFFTLTTTQLLPQNIMFIRDIQTQILDTVSISLHINNSEAFVAFQTDIKIPEGFTYINNSANLSERANGHILSANLIPGNILRVLAFSFNQNSFYGDTGVVLYFKLIAGDTTGIFPIELINPIISNSNSQNILTHFINGQITVSSIIVSVQMPIFYGIRNDNGIQLFWKTNNKENIQCFFIERQFSNSEWEPIGFVNYDNHSNQSYFTFVDVLKYHQKMNAISYRIKQVDSDGTTKYFDTISFEPENKSEKFQILMNYPNPFNSSTKIGIFSSLKTEIDFIITDVCGRMIKKETKTISSGYSEFEWDGKNSENIQVPSGIYFYSMSNQEFTKTIKMLLLR